MLENNIFGIIKNPYNRYSTHKILFVFDEYSYYINICNQIKNFYYFEIVRPR